MAKNKTNFTNEDVVQFIDKVENEQKRHDSFQLIDWMKEISGEESKMFGSSIIGFGEYHYKYASGHEGSAPILGFSPRKAAISLYISIGEEQQNELLAKLGKYTMGKACIYVKKLTDIDENTAKELMKDTIKFIEGKYTRIH